MAELRLRYNADAEEVELVVDGQVALSSGSDVFVNWVETYNEAHPPAPVVEEKEEEEVVEEVNEEESDSDSESEDAGTEEG